MRFGIVVGVLVLLAGCAGMGGPQRDFVAEELGRLELAVGEPVDRVSQFRIDGWRAVDDEHLILTASRHEHYLVELAHFCPELRHAFSIGLSSRTSSLTPLDSIVVRGIHEPLASCSIREIYRLVHVE